ncbi:MAG: AbrB/MazE/SpoVT family DNA-binding domain-containing protein [Gammaproteobacteria bacterium]|nr:AbrB/MazE/SpoVT family DNA-binding domain-containing protein [Gammaproteobacteria bacterium]
MTTTKLSGKYQVVIPKAVREALRLEAGQKFTVLTKGDLITLVPQRSLQDVRGVLKGHKTDGYRDRRDRV